jgi:hypothetical protein
MEVRFSLNYLQLDRRKHCCSFRGKYCLDL